VEYVGEMECIWKRSRRGSGKGQLLQECISGKSGVKLEIWSVFQRKNGVDLEMWSVYREIVEKCGVCFGKEWSVFIEMWSDRLFARGKSGENLEMSSAFRERVERVFGSGTPSMPS